MFVQDVLQRLTSIQDAGGEIRVVPEPHLGVDLVIVDLEARAGGSRTQLGGQGLPALLPPRVVVAGAA